MVWSYGTLCWTSQGIFPIQDLVDKEIKLWDGERWTKSKVELIGVSPLVSIIFSNGVKVCGGHGIKVDDELALLTSRNKPLQCWNPLPLSGTFEVSSPYLHGVFLSSAIVNEGKTLNPLVGDHMARIIDHPDMVKNEDSLSFPPFSCLEVPLNLNLQDKIDWIRGLFDSRGVATAEGLSFSTVINKFASQLQQLIMSLGAKVYINSSKNSTLIYSYEKEKVKEENLWVFNYQVIVPWDQLPLLFKLGFTLRPGIEVETMEDHRSLFVEDTVDHGIIGPMYRITGANKYVLNGLLLSFS